MIVDAQAKDQTSLYALDLLDAKELEEFESQLESFPELDRCVDEAREIIGAIALTAPQLQADTEILARIQRRIDPPSPTARIADAGSRFLSLRGGWPVAAALALFLGWQTTSRIMESARAAKEQKAEAGATSTRDGSMESKRGTRMGMSPVPESGSSTDGHSDFWNFVHKAGAKGDYVLIQDHDLLKAQLADLKRVNDSRFEPVPGVARMVVIEMADPSVPEGTEGERLLVTEEIGDILASGIEEATLPASTTEADPSGAEAKSEKSDEPPRPTYSGDQGQIIIDGGLPPAASFWPDSNESILHLDLPIEHAEHFNLWTDGNGNYYDGNNHLIWRPTEDGTGHLGTRPNGPVREEDFPFIPQPPDPEPAEVPSPGAASDVPAVAAEDPAESFPEETPADEASPLEAIPTRAWTMFNETNGRASIIVQNLPEIQDGSAFQLWFADPLSGDPLSAGLLPDDLTDGFGRVDFDLPKGFSPERFFLTVEPTNELHGSKKPTGAIVLEGP